MTKIGIPRALLYYYYYPFWKTLFTELDCEVVVSEETNKGIIGKGSRVTVSELCVPFKIYNGHIIDLLEKKVDYIFVPRFHSMGEEWYCPKFLGAPEIAEYSIAGLKDKMLEIEITCKNDNINLKRDYLPLCNRLGVDSKRLSAALKAATDVHKRFRSLCEMGYTCVEAFDIIDGGEPPKLVDSKVTIGLMGYVYNVYDNFVSMNAVKTLREMGARVVTFDMMSEDSVKRTTKFGKPPFWVFTRKVLNASRIIAKDKNTDGIIHLTAFGCGPDSVIGSMIEDICSENNVPFMTLRVDEHTGDSHARTRLEAFMDMIIIKKQKEETL